MARPIRLPASSARPLIRKLIAAGLNAADPYRALFKAVSLRGRSLQVGRTSYDLSRFDRLLVVGAGKASARMAQAIESILGSRLEGGLVVVKTGHGTPLKRITVIEAGHPIPDRAGLRAAEHVRTFVHGLTARDLVLVLLSGGASSLLPAPVPGITLTDKQRTTQLLLRSGASIGEMNTVRKHLSLLKGGGLSLSTKATLVTLILSDVIGDDIGTIGSGPTAPDPTTFADAIRVLQRCRIWRAVPATVRHHLLQGRKGTVPETLKPGSQRLHQVRHTIIGNNRGMLDAVACAAKQAGLRPLLLSTAIMGEARTAAEQFVGFARHLMDKPGRVRRPACLIAGGEPTVTVTGRGKGGRAQEFAATAALHLDGIPNVWLAAMGTDGTDGPTDAAGAVVTGETLTQAREIGLNLRSALNRHDTYHALQTLGCHIHTGPTGTNVNDLYLLLLL
jgi:hydroxypyruvate reductase